MEYRIMKGVLFGLIISTLFCFSVSGQYDRRMVAEWEPAFGTLIRWPLGIPSDLVVELAEDDSLYVLVETPTALAEAELAFTNWGVNLGHCRFMLINTYSHWTRDWGPHYVFDEEGIAHISDPEFDGYPWVPGCTGDKTKEFRNLGKGFEEDDIVNIALAYQLGVPLIDLPIYLTGGNIMTDGHGIAVSTQQMIDENLPICDEECFMNTNADSNGLHTYLITENPEVYGIQHMDCYAKFLDEETVLVKSLASWHPEYQCVEDLASYYMNRKSCYDRFYKVLRINCGSYNGVEVAAYTNSLILNKKVLVPLFGISTDQEALETYQQAMPGYEVIGFYYDLWYYYDALHCRAKAIFDPEMLRIWHKPIRTASAGTPVEVIALIDDRSNAGLIEDELKVYYRNKGEIFWQMENMNPAYGLDSFNVFLPSFEHGDTVEYLITAADSSGRSESLPRSAPDGYYSFKVIDFGTGTEELFDQPKISLFRQHGQYLLHVNPPGDDPYRIDLVDVHGRTVRIYPVVRGEFHSVVDIDPGVYIVRCTLNGYTTVIKAVVGI